MGDRLEGPYRHHQAHERDDPACDGDEEGVGPAERGAARLGRHGSSGSRTGHVLGWSRWALS